MELLFVDGLGAGLNALIAGLVGLHVLALVGRECVDWSTVRQTVVCSPGADGCAAHRLMFCRLQLYWVSKFVQDATKPAKKKLH